jgi:glucose-6-phosphate dehydrogenase assembly protein OpcA
MTAEEERTRLIGEIARVLREDPVTEEARCAALTFIGWLARRMPGEPVSLAGVREMIHERSRGDEPQRGAPRSGRVPRAVAIEEDVPSRRAR